MTSRCSISSIDLKNKFEVRNYISSLNNQNNLENKYRFGNYLNFINIKESKPVLSLKDEHEKFAKQGIQMSDNTFIINKIDEKKDKISKMFNVYKNPMIIIKTDMETNFKKHILSKTIGSGTITEIINERKNSILLKDKNYYEKYLFYFNDDIIFINEIEENNSHYGIICGNNNIYIVSHIKKILENISINLSLILQIKEKVYVISSDKGTYYYVGSIFEINSEHLKEETKISKIPFKNGVIIDNRYVFFVDNDLHNREGNLFIFDSIIQKTIKNNYNDLINNKYLFVKETLSVINLEENGNNIKIILCAYEGKENGILLIKKEADNINNMLQYCSPITDFIIKFICPLKDFNIINDKPIDTEYIIVVGENDKEMEMRLYKIKGLESNSYPTVEIVDYLFCKENISFDGMSFIIQSKENGNLILGYHDGYTKELCFCVDNN